MRPTARRALLQISEQNYGAYAAQGWLAGLDDHIKGTDIETGWAAAQKDLTWDGETRGVIVSNSSLMLFYNSKLLEDAGVAVPTSFAEYQTAVAGLHRAGCRRVRPLGRDHRAPDRGRGLPPLSSAMPAPAPIVDGKYNLTSPEAVAAIETYRNVVGKNAPLGNNSAVARQLFVDGTRLRS